MRESDIRPAAVHDRYLALSAADAEDYFGAAGERVYRPCPGCGSPNAESTFHKHGFAFETCPACGTLFANPVPSEDDLGRFYRDSPSAHYWATEFFPAVAEARREAIFAPRARRVAELAARHGTAADDLVDIGAGAGLFLEEYMKCVPHGHVRAVEPGDALAAQLAHKGMEVFHGYAADAAKQWPGSAAVVTCFEVIEHVTNPKDLIAELAGLARPNGLIIVSGLCADGFDIRVLGAASKAISPPHHLTFLSREGVARLAGRAGLELVSFFTPGELDVDIVRNALKENPDLPLDPDVRRIVEGDAQARAAHQRQLQESGQSSHMWLVLRRPAEAA